MINVLSLFVRPQGLVYTYFVHMWFTLSFNFSIHTELHHHYMSFAWLLAFSPIPLNWNALGKQNHLPNGYNFCRDKEAKHTPCVLSPPTTMFAIVLPGSCKTPALLLTLLSPVESANLSASSDVKPCKCYDFGLLHMHRSCFAIDWYRHHCRSFGLTLRRNRTQTNSACRGHSNPNWLFAGLQL